MIRRPGTGSADCRQRPTSRAGTDFGLDANSEVVSEAVTAYKAMHNGGPGAGHPAPE